MKLITFDQLGPLKGIRYSRDHLRRKCKAGEFPKPVQVSDSRIAWVDQEIDEFIAERLAERDAGPAVPPPLSEPAPAYRSAPGAVTGMSHEKSPPNSVDQSAT